MKKHLVKILLFVILTAMVVFTLSSCDMLNQLLGLGCSHEWETVEVDDATCTEDGVKSLKCAKCSSTKTETIPATGHQYDMDKYGYREEDGHAHKCISCDAHDAVVAHTSAGPATADAHEVCSVCNYVITPALNHEHEYTILAWTKKIGDGKPVERYNEKREIFSSCAGAALYRKSVLDEIGLFDEDFFAYVEDRFMDIGIISVRILLFIIMEVQQAEADIMNSKSNWLHEITYF